MHEYAIGAVVGGFIAGLSVWSWYTSPRLNGDEWVSFRASSCGRSDPRRNVFARCWAALTRTKTAGQ